MEVTSFRHVQLTSCQQYSDPTNHRSQTLWTIPLRRRHIDEEKGNDDEGDREKEEKKK